MELFNIICGICSILGLLISIFTVNRVVKITQMINCGNVNDHSKNENKVFKSTIDGGYVGRDIINGTKNSK